MRIVFYKPLQRQKWMYNHFLRRYLGFCHLKDAIQAKYPDCEVFQEVSFSQIMKRNPDIVGISSVTEVWEHAVYASNQLRKLGFEGPIFMGGPHVSVIPWSMPTSANCSVIGEGESSFVELVGLFREYKFPDLSQVQGIAYYRTHRGSPGSFVMTPPRCPENVNKLPVDVERDPAIVFDIATVRGCPFRCKHYVESVTQGNPRVLSADRLYHIMKTRFEKTGNPHFFFQDDTFLAAPKSRLRDLHTMAKRDGMLGKFKIRSISLNANLVDEENITLMSELGCYHFGMGCESFNPRVLEDMKNGQVTSEDLDRTVQICNKLKIKLEGSQVYGFPSETEEEMRDSIRRCQEYERNTTFKHWTVFICTPLPGSQLWHWARDKGFVNDGMDWSTLRIDGDKQHFKTPWVYINGESVPRQKFIEILREIRQLPSTLMV